MQLRLYDPDFRSLDTRIRRSYVRKPPPLHGNPIVVYNRLALLLNEARAEGRLHEASVEMARRLFDEFAASVALCRRTPPACWMDARDILWRPVRRLAPRIRRLEMARYYRAYEVVSGIDEAFRRPVPRWVPDERRSVCT